MALGWTQMDPDEIPKPTLLARPAVRWIVAVYDWDTVIPAESVGANGGQLARDRPGDRRSASGRAVDRGPTLAHN
ncbi:MAG: hypothetical protein Fur0042_03660 [Cyanophyceae cyanobacterium]